MYPAFSFIFRSFIKNVSLQYYCKKLNVCKNVSQNYKNEVKRSFLSRAAGCFGVSCRQTDLWLKTETGNRAWKFSGTKAYIYKNPFKPFSFLSREYEVMAPIFKSPLHLGRSKSYNTLPLSSVILLNWSRSLVFISSEIKRSYFLSQNDRHA